MGIANLPLETWNKNKLILFIHTTAHRYSANECTKNKVKMFRALLVLSFALHLIFGDFYLVLNMFLCKFIPHWLIHRFSNRFSGRKKKFELNESIWMFFWRCVFLTFFPICFNGTSVDDSSNKKTAEFARQKKKMVSQNTEIKSTVVNFKSKQINWVAVKWCTLKIKSKKRAHETSIVIIKYIFFSYFCRWRRKSNKTFSPEPFSSVYEWKIYLYANLFGVKQKCFFFLFVFGETCKMIRFLSCHEKVFFFYFFRFGIKNGKRSNLKHTDTFTMLRHAIVTPNLIKSI